MWAQYGSEVKEPRARTPRTPRTPEIPLNRGEHPDPTHENRACCEIAPPPGRSVPPAQPRARPRGPRHRDEAGASGLTPRPVRRCPRRRAQDAQGRSGPFASTRTRSRAAGGSPWGQVPPHPSIDRLREAMRARSPPHRARRRSTTSARSRPASPAFTGTPRKRSETLTACCSSRPGKHADPALVL